MEEIISEREREKEPQIPRLGETKAQKKLIKLAKIER